MGKPEERWHYLDRAELPADTKAVPNHMSSGMHPCAQEVRTGPSSQLNSLHLRQLMHRKAYFGVFFFFPPGCFPVGEHVPSWECNCSLLREERRNFRRIWQELFLPQSHKALEPARNHTPEYSEIANLDIWGSNPIAFACIKNISSDYNS